MDPRLLKPIVWLAAAGTLLILTALQLMRALPATVATGAGLLVLAAAWFGLKGGRRR